MDQDTAPLCRCGLRTFQFIRRVGWYCEGCIDPTDECLCPKRHHADLTFLLGVKDGVGKKQQWWEG